jgi:hypothetical protein
VVVEEEEEEEKEEEEEEYLRVARELGWVHFSTES